MTKPILAVYPHGNDETAEEAAARIGVDVAAGTRCSSCWLLRPCGGHDINEARRPPDWVGEPRRERTRTDKDRIRDNQRNRRAKAARAAEGRSR